MYTYTSVEDKLVAFIDIPRALNNCWLWIGPRQKTGHGKFYWKGRYTSAHRAVYKTFVDSDIDGLDVDHLCRNPSCVNPDHLEPVTSRENTLRGISPPAVNARKTHCLNGHEFTPENTIKGRQRRCKQCEYAKWRIYYQKNKERLNRARVNRARG